jgi:hypothetical protein
MGLELVPETSESHVLTLLSAQENFIEQHSSTRAKVRTTVLVTVRVLWDVTPGGRTEIHQRLGAACCLYLHGRM